MSKSVLTSIALIVVLVGAMVAWHFFYPGHNDNPMKPGQAVVIPDFDSFQRDLASRVTSTFNVPAESVVVAPASYDIGTLLDPVQALPSDSTDCVPTPLPKAVAAEHLFPAYQLSSNTAATTTLGSEALQNISSASLSLAHNASVTYSIQNAQVQFMDVKTVDQVGTVGACGDYVKQHPKVRLIRGLVTGKVSFTLKVDNPSSMTANVAKLGGVSATSDPNDSTVTVADDQPSEILQMLWVYEGTGSQPPAAVPSPVTGPAATGAGSGPVGGSGAVPVRRRAMMARRMGSTLSPPEASAPAPGLEPAPSLAPAGSPAPAPPPAVAQADVPAVRAVAPGQPHVYLQQDASDTSGAAQRIGAGLTAAWPEAVVERKVERIPTAKMPSLVQVRFFNAGDQALAATCRDRLKAATGIVARVVRIGLAAPAGQLEVWIPKG